MEKIKNILISPYISIKQALKLMDSAAKKILFVVDAQNTILGSVTDGDIRRWILKGSTLDAKVVRIMNKKPVFLKGDYSINLVKEKMLSEAIECLPIVDGKNRIINAIWWMDLFNKKPVKIKTIDAPVVIMAGGQGSRLSPFTQILPKPLLPIGDKTIIELIIDKFVEYGCYDFYLSVNYKANIIKAFFSDFDHEYKIKYILEDKPLGTAGSLYLLKNRIKKTFFVSNCDILIEADYVDILELHHRKRNKITLVTSMKNYAIPYGVCEIENGGTLKNIREKPEYDFLVNTGMYVLEPEVIESIKKNKFYNITDLIDIYIEKKESVGVYPVSEKSWLDMGQFEELKNVLKRFEL